MGLDEINRSDFPTAKDQSRFHSAKERGVLAKFTVPGCDMNCRKNKGEHLIPRGDQIPMSPKIIIARAPMNFSSVGQIESEDRVTSP